MKTAMNYETINNEQYAPYTPCYNAPAIDEKKIRRTKLGVIARLAVSALFFLFILCSSITYLFEIPADSFTDGLNTLIQGIGSSFMMATIPWILMKWGGYILPQSYAWANKMWRSWIPFTIFGLIVKVMLWIYIVFLPISLSSMATLPYLLVCKSLMNAGANLLLSLLFAAGFALLCALLVKMDLKKFRSCNAQ